MPITVLMTTTQHEEEDDKNDDGKQNGAGLAGDLLDPLIAGAGEIAEHREADRPNETAGSVEGEIPRIVHASRPSQAGHHCAEECGEPGEEHCASTLRPQRLLGVSKAQLTAGEDPGREEAGPKWRPTS